MLEAEQMSSILNDICNFQLVIFGIGVTLFTVIYSFVLSKRDELRGYNDQIKNGNDNPLINQKYEFARAYIIRFKRINRHIRNVIILSFLIYVLTWPTKEFLLDDQSNLFYVSAFFTVLSVLYIIIIFTIVLKHYNYSTQV